MYTGNNNFFLLISLRNIIYTQSLFVDIVHVFSKHLCTLTPSLKVFIT